MEADTKTPNLTAAAEAARADRLARDAAALRENLRRRKAQGRARSQTGTQTGTQTGAQTGAQTGPETTAPAKTAPTDAEG